MGTSMVRIVVCVACALMLAGAVGLSAESDVAQLAEVSAESVEASQTERNLAWAREKFDAMPSKNAVQKMLGEAATCSGGSPMKFGKTMNRCFHAVALLTGAAKRAVVKKKLKKKAKKKLKKKKKKERASLELLEEDQSDFQSDA